MAARGVRKIWWTILFSKDIYEIEYKTILSRTEHSQQTNNRIIHVHVQRNDTSEHSYMFYNKNNMKTTGNRNIERMTFNLDGRLATPWPCTEQPYISSPLARRPNKILRRAMVYVSRNRNNFEEHHYVGKTICINVTLFFSKLNCSLFENIFNEH